MFTYRLKLLVMRRIKIYLCISIGLSVLLILNRNLTKYNLTYLTSLDTHVTFRSYQTEDKHEESVQQAPSKNYYDEIDESPNIEKILEVTRSKIKKDLLNYNFTYSGVHKLDELLMESGGTPVRSLVISAWRSGSTFLGELLNAMPSNFYHYEPLLKYQIKQIRGPPNAAEATRNLKSMFTCNYTGMDDYFEYGKTHLKYLNQFEHNTRLWEQCKHKIELCFDAEFTAHFCKLFPFHSMKVVRFRLHLVKDILEDKELNVKVVLLVRDPRGVMQSRRYRHYCRPAPDCSNPALVCADMISDYVAAGKLILEYPGRIMVVRYEGLILNLNVTTRQLLKFLRLGLTQSIVEFLYTHTNVEDGGIDSTFRVSRKVPFKWKKVLNFDYVDEIQESCKEAMALWGYQLALNASHMASEDFFPLLPYYSVTQINNINL